MEKSKTVFGRSAIKIFLDRITEEPEYTAVYKEYLGRMKNGEYALLDAISQTMMPFDIVDAMVFSDVHVGLLAGDILYATIEVGQSPFNDKAVDENNKALSNLPRPFSANFVGGAGDEDGYLKWTETIKVSVIDMN